MAHGRTPAAALGSPLAVLALLALSPRAHAADGDLLVVLRASSATAGPFIRLGEIADLPGGPPRISAFAAEILLGFAPAPGAVREIESSEVESRLREAGLGEGRFLVKGAPRASVFIAEGHTPSAAREPETKSAPAAPPAKTGRTPEPPRRGRAALKPTAAVRRPGGVEKGDMVTIRKVGRTLILEEPARVLESAGPGDRIEVQNLRTGKKLPARVDGPGAVTPLHEDDRESGEKSEGKGE